MYIYIHVYIERERESLLPQSPLEFATQQFNHARSYSICLAWALEHIVHQVKAKVNLLHRTVRLTNSSTGLRQKLPRTVAFRLRKVHTLRPKELHPKVRLPGDGCDELPQMKSKNWGRFVAMYNPGLVQFHNISWLCASGSRRPREKTAWVPWSRRRRRRIAFRKSFAWCECMHMGYGNSWNMGLGQSTPRKSVDIWYILTSFVHTPLSQNWWEAKCNGLQILLTGNESNVFQDSRECTSCMPEPFCKAEGCTDPVDEQLTRQCNVLQAITPPTVRALDSLDSACELLPLKHRVPKGQRDCKFGWWMHFPIIFLGWVWYAYSSLFQRILVLSYFIIFYLYIYIYIISMCLFPRLICSCIPSWEFQVQTCNV